MAKKSISIFGSAKTKTATASKKDDKEVVYVDGLEEKLLELQFLKAQISDLEAQLVGVTDEIKAVSKEKFVELYQSKRSNPNSFYIKDGEGCVMVIPMDKYISVKDEDRANQLMENYGDEVVTIDEKYYFNNEVLERNMKAIEKLIRDAKTISDSDKENLLVREVKYSVAKGFIDRLYDYGDTMENVMNDVQPIITLKNCGGKMADGGELSSDFIANIYADGGELSDIEDGDDVKMAFKTDFALEVYEDDELDNAIEEIFKAGEVFEVTVFGVDEYKYDVQFGDGSVAFIRKENVDIISVNEYGKGGKVGKYKYIPNRMIQAMEVERNGKTTEIDGANILDGLYVKDKVKFEYGGQVMKLSKSALEAMVGRKLDGWNDDVVYYDGVKYTKCFLKPYYHYYPKFERNMFSANDIYEGFK